MLEAYLDASGTPPDQQVVVVAGWGATEAEWDHWERLWLEMLAELGLKKGWHHTDFLSRRNEYEDWKDAKFLFAEATLINIFNEIGLLGIGAAVRRADYEAALASGRWKNVQPDPYGFCLNDCVEGLIHGNHEVPNDEGIAIYADKDGKAFEKIGNELFKWHTDYNRRNAGTERKISTTYGPTSQYIPLQAADVLANETYRYMFKPTGIPKLGGVFIGSEDTASPIIRALHGSLGQSRAVLDVVLYNKAMLEERLDSVESVASLRRDAKMQPQRFIRTKKP